VHILGLGEFTCAALCVIASVCAHLRFGGVHLCRAVCHSERVCTFWVRGSSIFTCAALCVTASMCAHLGSGNLQEHLHDL